jgi:hypothetical protein
VLGPAGLFLERPRRVPIRTGTAEHHKKHRHGRILQSRGR